MFTGRRYGFTPTRSRPSSRSRPASGDSKPATAGRHVLYVDDEPALRVFVRELLEFEGFEVTVCASAYEALQQLHERAAVFDVVVTDYNMPGHSGLDVAAEVARHRPGLPVIISSGYFTPELQRKAETLGVLALVNKADLVSRLPTLLKSVLAMPAPRAAQDG